MFGLFRKKNKVTPKRNSDLHQNENYVCSDLEYILSNIKYGASSHKDIPFSKEERIFFQELVDQCKAKRINPRKIRLTRLSNGCINVATSDCYIGKINLYGKRTYMQIPVNLYDVKVIESQNFDDYLSAISYWIKYMKL